MRTGSAKVTVFATSWPERSDVAKGTLPEELSTRR